MINFYPNKKARMKRITRLMSTVDSPRKTMTITEAIRTVINQEMVKDKNIIVIGDDSGKYNVQNNTFTTQGTDTAQLNIAIGAALNGLKPICLVKPFTGALFRVIAQLSNASLPSKSLPIVFHAFDQPNSVELLAHSLPIVKVVTPYDAEDAKGLMKSAIWDSGPVIFLESSRYSKQTFPMSPMALSENFATRIGVAKIQKVGNEVTIVTHSDQVESCMTAAQRLKEGGVEVEVINLRSLNPLDERTIFQSLKKTNRLLIVERAWARNGVAGEIVSRVSESEGFFHLDAPILRLCQDTPIDSNTIVNAVYKALSKK